MSTTVRSLIETQAGQRPQAVYACDAQGQSGFTYAELARNCRQTAAWLSSLGSQPGETVSVVMPNG